MLIYRIYNKVNGKSYIGQTIKSSEERWQEHLQHTNGTHINDQSKVLYKAMRKYGIDNFVFEVLQDNIDTYEQLDKAEIYWIDYYDSFLHGYNATRGGQLYHSYLPCDEIIQDYLKTRSARKTAKNFHLDHSTVDSILNSSNVPRFNFEQSVGKRIIAKNDTIQREFDSIKQCSEWLVENNYCRTKKPICAVASIRNALKRNGKYAGFYFSLIEE